MNLSAATLDALIVDLEKQIDQQVSSILHHPEFRALEARWASLRLLVHSVSDEFVENADEAPEQDHIVISVWDVAKDELADDLKYVESLRRSALFTHIYSREYGVAGGQPYGILLSDYSFSDHPGDVKLLRDIASVCEAAFSPFVAAASPTMFHVDGYEQLYGLTRRELRGHRRSLLTSQFNDDAYIEWNDFRRSFNSRFVILALPRFLVRQSYDPGRFLGRRAEADDDQQPHPYDENRFDSPSDRILWGNPAFAVGQVVLQSFANSGWLADIHGLPDSPARAGVVPLVVTEQFGTDEPDLFAKFVTEIMITDELEKELSELGFMSLCDRYPSPRAFIGSSTSVCLPDESDEPNAQISQRLSSMLNYMLCACRFAHYIKRIGHDHVGTAGSAEDYQRTLHEFLIQFVLNDENASAELKARQPLNDAEVRVTPVPGKPGEFHCGIMLKPHYELDAVEVHLETGFVGREAS